MRRNIHRIKGDEGTSIQNGNEQCFSDVDLGRCWHGMLDDQDCVECRTNGCSGPGNCDCGTRTARAIEED